jgi:hypothetical protein
MLFVSVSLSFKFEISDCFSRKPGEHYTYNWRPDQSRTFHFPIWRMHESACVQMHCTVYGYL